MSAYVCKCSNVKQIYLKSTHFYTKMGRHFSKRSKCFKTQAACDVSVSSLIVWKFGREISENIEPQFVSFFCLIMMFYSTDDDLLSKVAHAYYGWRKM